MDTEQLQAAKEALQAELADNEAKEERLRNIDMLMSDIARLDHAEQLLLTEDVTTFHDTVLKTPYRARITTATGKQVTFETQRPDEYRRTDAAELTVNIPKGLSMMNEYRWVMIAVMRDRVGKRIQKLLDQGDDQH